jgi:hypothetical protein
MSNPTAPSRTARAAGPGTSARLHRAAAAERAKLARKRDQLARRSETLRSERQQVEIILSAVEEQIALLDRLTGVSVVAPSPRAPEDGAPPDSASGSGPGRRSAKPQHARRPNRASRAGRSTLAGCSKWSRMCARDCVGPVRAARRWTDAHRRNPDR